jgi:hypothetical protein
VLESKSRAERSFSTYIWNRLPLRLSPRHYHCHYRWGTAQAKPPIKENYTSDESTSQKLSIQLNSQFVLTRNLKKIRKKKKKKPGRIVKVISQFSGYELAIPFL